MKFIKTIDGYIDLEKVWRFEFREDLKLKSCIIFAHSHEDFARLAVFGDIKQAQAYLEKLVGELNEEKA